MTAEEVAGLTLVTGPEELLVERAIADVVGRARAGGADVVRVDGPTYEAGALAVHASPSLFGGTTCIVVRNLHDAVDELHDDLLDLLASQPDEVRLVVTHASGNRGKKVLDALRKRGAVVVQCPTIKLDREKADFVSREFARAGRAVRPDAVRALVEAVGQDVRELASACAQLVADTQGVVDAAMVHTYHGGKVEATGFRVAESAVAGQTGDALRLLRHALATGVDPVPIIAVLAAQLRQVIRVAAAGRGSPGQLASALGMPSWQVDKARRLAESWSAEGLAIAVRAVAAADFEIKGGGRDPVYALERAVLSLARARSVR